MERSKLKLTVILLLAILNVVLLGKIVAQDQASRAYAETGRTQAVVYLQNNGIGVQEAAVPWESGLRNKPAAELVLNGDQLPEGKLPQAYDILELRGAETLLTQFVVGLASLGETCTVIREIQEGYWYSSDGKQALLTPVWRVVTDRGSYLLDGNTGTLRHLYE